MFVFIRMCCKLWFKGNIGFQYQISHQVIFVLLSGRNSMFKYGDYHFTNSPVFKYPEFPNAYEPCKSINVKEILEKKDSSENNANVRLVGNNNIRPRLVFGENFY